MSTWLDLKTHVEQQRTEECISVKSFISSKTAPPPNLWFKVTDYEEKQYIKNHTPSVIK